MTNPWHQLNRVASASPELRVGDVEFNVARIIDALVEAQKHGSGYVVFPELCITGYSCADLFFQPHILVASKNALLDIAAVSKNLDVVAIVGVPVEHDGCLYNCAAVISSGKVLGLVPKQYLPNSKEFYEKRWFRSGLNARFEIPLQENISVPLSDKILFTCEDLTFGVEICEDLWAPIPPSSFQALAGAQLIFNLSASNELIGKADYRKKLVQQQSARTISAYVYSSAGPCESSIDLVFSGHCLISENGQILSESKRFNFNTEIIYADIDIGKIVYERLMSSSFADAVIADNKYERVQFKAHNSKNLVLKPQIGSYRVNHPHPFVPSDPLIRNSVCTEIFSIQASGLAKRIKHLGVKKVVIGISGGLDSTLAFLVCLKAFEILDIRRSGIVAVTMPGFGTSNRTKSNAEALIELTGATLRVIPIEEVVTKHFSDIGHDSRLHDITFENAQARERTQILMDISNQVNGFVVGTGDLSESALGWCTFNGDQISMYHVNAGVPKTLVKYLVEWCASEIFDSSTRKVLEDICNTPVSPELLPLDINGEILQQTEDVVGPYELHDYFLYSFMRCGYAPSKILYMAGLAFEGRYADSVILKWLNVFISRFFSQQFKRSNMPDGPKVGSVALSPRGDWRMPSDACADLWLKDLDKFKK